MLKLYVGLIFSVAAAFCHEQVYKVKACEATYKIHGITVN